jgi:hypothetical protein
MSLPVVKLVSSNSISPFIKTILLPLYMRLELSPQYNESYELPANCMYQKCVYIIWGEGWWR